MHASSIFGLVVWLLAGGCGRQADEQGFRAVERTDVASSGLSADEQAALRARARAAAGSLGEARETASVAPAASDADSPALQIRLTPSPNQAPTTELDDDRIYLFNGRDLSGWRPSGPYSDWHVEKGVLNTGSSAAYVLDEQGRRFPVYATSDLISERKFWNFQLHVEFRCPQVTVLPNSALVYRQVHQIELFSSKEQSEFHKNWKGDPPGAEPSLWRRMSLSGGVYLRGRYRVHLAAKGWESLQPMGSLVLRDNPYGRCGAIYGKVPVMHGAAGLPDEWQTLDVTLIGRTVTVVLNGETVIDEQEIPGPTGGTLDIRESELGPVVLQGFHAGPTAYRSVWVKELPGASGNLPEPSPASSPQIEIPKHYRSWVPRGGKPSAYLPLAKGNRWVYRITTRPVARASQWRRIAWSDYKRPRFKGDDGYRAVDTFAREPFHAHSFFRMGAGSVYRGFAGGGWSAGGLNDWRGVERLTYRVVREATDQSGWWLIDAQTNQGLTPEDYRWDWHGIEQVRWGPPGRMYEFGNLSRVRAFEPLDVLCERLVGGSPGYRLLAFAPDHPFDWVPPLSPSHRIAARWADEPVVVPAGRFGRCWESAYYHKYKGCTWSEKAYLAKGVGLVKREQSVQYGNKEAVVTTLWELESYQVKEE